MKNMSTVFKRKLVWIAILASLLTRVQVTAEVIELECKEDLRDQVWRAPAGSELVASEGCVWQTNTSVQVHRPMTIRGVRVRLMPGIRRKPAIWVASKGVSITDFILIGNKGTIPQSQRQSLLWVSAGNFILERGRLVNSSRDGIMVHASRSSKIDPEPVRNGVIRDITGTGNNRDLVALTTAGDGAITTSHVLVENIKAFNSDLRGAVEVGDGVEDIVIRNVYARGCYYTIAIQDHQRSELETNNRVEITNVVGVANKYGILSQTHRPGHGHINITGMVFIDCRRPILLKYIDFLSLSDLRVEGTREQFAPIEFEACRDLSVQDISIRDSSGRDGAMVVHSSKRVRVEGLTLDRETTQFAYGIEFYKPVGWRETYLNTSSINVESGEPLKLFEI
ncbi:hypothetical protein NDN08_004538 [Rhodosorus marinus]|uniref:Right handed beta helix domain-containing protein n=1 Tax=Rhodosorus marinus TaxID=101924 RepID=A0AAV8ULJ6_9RHOD|nr:hypothetical protein NDN08_004538 [Rhodosorus marinus]